MKIFKNNPIFVLMLGLCSALAITTTLENAIIMGLTVTIVLTCSNMIVSLLRKVIADSIRIPAYILIISTFVTILEILINKYAPLVSHTLGIYIPLIIVNCVILGRALDYASKNNVYLSIKDGFINGIGYMVALMIIAFIREVLGNGTISIISNLEGLFGFNLIFKLPNLTLIPNPLFVSPAGAFLIFGIVLMFINKDGEKNESN